MTEPIPDVLDPNCGSRRILELIADRWSILVVYALRGGSRRYAELGRHIGGVSQKMLTQTLRSLERNGVIGRTVYPEVPPRVEYELTPLGVSLLDVLGQMCRWAESHISDVDQSRERFDATIARNVSGGMGQALAGGGWDEGKSLPDRPG